MIVKLNNRPDRIQLSIKDNGRGIAQHDRHKPRSFGLRGLQERVSHFGGTFRLESKPGKGATVSVSLPHQMRPDVDLPDLLPLPH